MAGAAGPILKLYSGATNGTKTTAITFKYRYGGAATGSANAYVLGTQSTSAALQHASHLFIDAEQSEFHRSIVSRGAETDQCAMGRNCRWNRRFRPDW